MQPIGMLPPFRVTRSHSVKPRRCRPAQSDRSQCFLVHDHADLAAQQVKQNRDTIAIGHPLKQPKARGKHAVNDTNGLTRREPRLA